MEFVDTGRMPSWGGGEREVENRRETNGSQQVREAERRKVCCTVNIYETVELGWTEDGRGKGKGILDWEKTKLKVEREEEMKYI